jgi:hypothetical protein
MKHVTGFWRTHLGTTRQGADASQLTDGHSVAEIHADQHGTVGFPSLLWPIAGTPHQQPWPVHLCEWETVQKISIDSNYRVPMWGQDLHSNILTLMDSALVFNHLNDSQSRCQQNLPSFTTNWQFVQIQNLRSYIYFHFTLLRWNLQDGTYLHVLLTCPKYPVYQSVARPFHKLSRTYISTVLPERFFTKGDGVAQKRIWNYFTNLLTDVASCMCVAQGRSNLPIGNVNSYSSVGFQC